MQNLGKKTTKKNGVFLAFYIVFCIKDLEILPENEMLYLYKYLLFSRLQIIISGLFNLQNFCLQGSELNYFGV
jgi:hypothetical protein